MPVVRLIKTELTNSIQTLYTCCNSVETASNIIICNTSSNPVTLFLYFVPAGGSEPTGAVFSGSRIAANSTLMMSEKNMMVGDKIKGYAGVTSVIKFSTDILR